MYQHCVCCAGKTPALKYARGFLEAAGVPVTDNPTWDTKHVLLDVPSFRPGLWTEKALDTLLSSLPREIRVWGGNLNHPALAGFRTVDFLQNEEYLLENAVITAQCTIPIAESLLNAPWEAVPVLIIGWGRIGKALAAMLKDKGCIVTVASGTQQHRFAAEEQGFSAIDSHNLTDALPTMRLIVNTAPAKVLSKEDVSLCPDSVKIDLASVKGIEGDDVHWARALPGRYAPERSGFLIAKTFLHLQKEEMK